MFAPGRRDRGRTLLDDIRENFCETDLGGRSRQIQVRPIVGDAPRIRHLCLHAARSPIDQVDSHFQYAFAERRNVPRDLYIFLNGCSLPPKPHPRHPKQIQARPVVVGVVQIRCPRWSVEH
jgi:hypothetical protein